MFFGASNDVTWYSDSGSTHHMTPNASILDSLTPYVGSDQVVVSNGVALSIAHMGRLVYKRNDCSLHLKYVLYILSLTHNLLYVPKLCRDNNSSITFDDLSFVINDRQTGILLLHRALMSRCIPSDFLLHPLLVLWLHQFFSLKSGMLVSVIPTQKSSGFSKEIVSFTFNLSPNFCPMSCLLYWKVYPTAVCYCSITSSRTIICYSF